LTSFSWNIISPSLIVTSSIDTTCTVWDISTSTAVTQLIAHDREVYDVSWVPGSTDSFVSVGADGSLRAFDLRSLEHSTILYETPPPKPVANPSAASPPTSARPLSAPLLRIAFDPLDANHLATFHMDSSTVQILDMRSPGRPVAELKGHSGAVSAIGWGSQEGHMLATSGDDCQVMIWDLSGGVLSPRTHPRSTGPASPRPDAQMPPRIVNDPFLAYTTSSEIGNLTWSPPISNMGLGGNAAPSEWVAIASGRNITTLRV
jgi:WD repeat-containing protein 68